MVSLIYPDWQYYSLDSQTEESKPVVELQERITDVVKRVSLLKFKKTPKQLEKNFICELCNRKYGYKPNLRAHQKKKHPEAFLPLQHK